MEIPRGFRPGTEAALNRELAQTGRQEQAAGFAKAAAANRVGATLTQGVAGLALAEQGKQNKLLSTTADAKASSAIITETNRLEEIARTREITDDDIASARQGIESSISGLSLPPGYEENFAGLVDSFQEEKRGAAAKANYARAQNNAKVATSEAYLTAVDAGDYGVAKALANSMGGQPDLWTPAQVQAAKDGVVFAEETRKVMDLLAEDDVEGAREYSDNFIKRKNMSADMARQLTGSTNTAIARYEADIAQAEAEQAAAYKDQRDEQMAMLYNATAFGVPNERGTRDYVSIGELDAMLEADSITQKEYKGLAAAAHTRSLKQDIEGETLTALLGPSDMLITFDAKHQKAADKFIAETFPPLQEYSTWDDESKAQMNGFMTRGYVPTAVTDLLDVGISKNNTRATASSVEIFRSFKQSNADMADNIDIETQAFYTSVGNLTDMGVPVEAAVDQTRILENMTPEEKQFSDYKLREQWANTEDVQNTLERSLRGAELPEAGASAMMPMYTMALQDANRILRGKDTKAASQVALSRTLANFGVTTMTPDGTPAMALHPMERSVEGNTYSAGAVMNQMWNTLREQNQIKPDTNRFDYVPEYAGAKTKAYSATGEPFMAYAYRIRKIPKDDKEQFTELYLQDESGLSVLYTPDFLQLNVEAQEEAAKEEERFRERGEDNIATRQAAEDARRQRAALASQTMTGGPI